MRDLFCSPINFHTNVSLNVIWKCHEMSAKSLKKVLKCVFDMFLMYIEVMVNIDNLPPPP